MPYPKRSRGRILPTVLQPPSFADEISALASLKAEIVADRAAFIANGGLSRADDFATSMEARLAAERAKAPTDERAVTKLAYIARKSRFLVFCK